MSEVVVSIRTWSNSIERVYVELAAIFTASEPTGEPNKVYTTSKDPEQEPAQPAYEKPNPSPRGTLISKYAAAPVGPQSVEFDASMTSHG